MKRGIGGSDLASVCAYYRPEYAAEWAKWATAADVWMRLVHDIERPRTAVMQRGIDAEPRLRQAYLDAYGGSMVDKPTPWIVRHPRLPFVSVSPDDVWCESATGCIGNLPHTYVEFKSASVFGRHKYGDPETDAIPDAYGLQVQLGLEILDIEVGHLFVGFGKDATAEDGTKRFFYSETARYVIQRDRELMAMALGYAERFYAEHVATRKPPSVEPKNNIRAWKRLLKEQSWKATEAQPSQSST